MKRLLDVVPDTVRGRRDRAILLVFILTGRRRSEVMGMTAGEIEIEVGTVFYRYRGKGGKRGRRELPRPAWDAIRRTLGDCGKDLASMDPDESLWQAGAGPRRLSGSTFYARFRRYLVVAELAIARLDARLKSLGTEIAALAPERGMAVILSEIEATRRERERLAAQPKQDALVDPEDALAWLASLGTLWRDTSDEGRRQFALATFERINVISSSTRPSHRIVGIEMTEEAGHEGDARTPGLR